MANSQSSKLVIVLPKYLLLIQHLIYFNLTNLLETWYSVQWRSELQKFCTGQGVFVIKLFKFKESLWICCIIVWI